MIDRRQTPGGAGTEVMAAWQVLVVPKTIMPDVRSKVDGFVSTMVCALSDSSFDLLTDTSSTASTFPYMNMSRLYYCSMIDHDWAYACLHTLGSLRHVCHAASRSTCISHSCPPSALFRRAGEVMDDPDPLGSDNQESQIYPHSICLTSSILRNMYLQDSRAGTERSGLWEQFSTKVNLPCPCQIHPCLSSFAVHCGSRFGQQSCARPLQLMRYAPAHSTCPPAPPFRTIYLIPLSISYTHS